MFGCVRCEELGAGAAGGDPAMEEDTPDPQALVQCPYDKSHRVRVARLPYHLVKCERNNPQVARQLAICPFNARHRVPHAELQRHLASCPDRRPMDVPLEAPMKPGADGKSPEAPAAWQSPPCQEDWDAELEGLEDAPPFIFKVTTGELRLPSDRRTPAAPQRRTRGTVPRPGAELDFEGLRMAAGGPGQRSSAAPLGRGHRWARGGQ